MEFPFIELTPEIIGLDAENGYMHVQLVSADGIMFATSIPIGAIHMCMDKLNKSKQLGENNAKSQ